MTSSSSDVIIEEKGKAGIVILNRPKALNAINTSMVKYELCNFAILNA
jgi:enoyl-CoA hydratase/carnithine racemase